MGLADFEPERVTIEHRGKVLVAVRGLCLDDISILVRGHMGTLNNLYAAANSGEIASLGGERFVLDLLTVAPDVAFDVIALACDEAEYGAQARKLPVGLQVKMLQEIMRLTLEDVGGPLGLLALVKGLVNTPEKLLPAPQPPSIQ